MGRLERDPGRWAEPRLSVQQTQDVLNTLLSTEKEVPQRLHSSFSQAEFFSFSHDYAGSLWVELQVTTPLARRSATLSTNWASYDPHNIRWSMRHFVDFRHRAPMTPSSLPGTQNERRRSQDIRFTLNTMSRNGTSAL